MRMVTGFPNNALGFPMKRQGGAATIELNEPAALVNQPFDRLPPERLVSAFGVEYGHLVLPEGGDLYVTRMGWPWARQLLPAHWYADEWYAREGEHLPGATGHVYHVRTRPVAGRSADLVVKFSRVAQDVSIVIETSFPDDVPPEILAAARFNSPMEEFGLVMQLRGGAPGSVETPLLTQRPLAIYAPPQEFEMWQLGRAQSSFHSHRLLLAADQEDAVKAIELDIKRIYVLLYGWIKGRDAEQSFQEGHLSESEFTSLVPRVVQELRRRGFQVLDNKPRHFILRRSQKTGSLLRRSNGDLIYGLVDFELLQRTAEHQARFRRLQQERFHKLQLEASQAVTPSRSFLPVRRVLGVDYRHGAVHDGGHLWVVGTQPALFDYFLPERWRRTARVKLSPTSEVYRTRTRDNLHVVYRRSRVGSQPRVDPLSAEGRAVRAFGYNSPFEEVVISERLRQMGVPTTIARAVYRTGHASMSTALTPDFSRFQRAASEDPGNTGPDGPDLLAGYDYYTVWSYFRGLGPGFGQELQDGVDVEQAVSTGLLTRDQQVSIAARLHRTLEARGLHGLTLADFELQVYPDSADCVQLDAEGEVITTFGVDALRALELGLLDLDSYRATLERLAARLRAADCEKLDLEGNHILLSLDVDGRFTPDREGEPALTLCNFEFVRGLYRPIR